MAFDKIKFYQAAALLKSFRSNIPKDYIRMNHVADYHSYIKDLQEQVGVDLSKFLIPPNAIYSRVKRTSVSFDEHGNPSPSSFPTETVCDRDVFKRQLDAVILFIDTYLDNLRAEQSKKK